MNRFACFFAIIALGSCAAPRGDTGALVAPVTNNAVAFARDAAGRGTIYSFLGLGPGKSYKDIVRSAYACVEATLECRVLPDVPVAEGRLASAAANVGGKIYIFGGYTVAADGAEKSTPEVFRFDPVSEEYARVADIPLPVDDSTAVVLFDRYVYLISGWHDDGNVALSQVYDVQDDRWFGATDFPGSPVFGQAGGGGESHLMIAGGVKSVSGDEGKRKFVASNEVWIGAVSESAPEEIAWSRASAPPVGPYYRMAASQGRSKIYVAGGGDNPYNYNGVGYDGVPAKPSDRFISYDVATNVWTDEGAMPPSMDHRGLVAGEKGLYVVGGLGPRLAVLNRITRIKP